MEYDEGGMWVIFLSATVFDWLFYCAFLYMDNLIHCGFLRLLQWLGLTWKRDLDVNWTKTKVE